MLPLECTAKCDCNTVIQGFCETFNNNEMPAMCWALWFCGCFSKQGDIPACNGLRLGSPGILAPVYQVHKHSVNNWSIQNPDLDAVHIGPGLGGWICRPRCTHAVTHCTHTGFSGYSQSVLAAQLTVTVLVKVNLCDSKKSIKQISNFILTELRQWVK